MSPKCCKCTVKSTCINCKCKKAGKLCINCCPLSLDKCKNQQLTLPVRSTLLADDSDVDAVHTSDNANTSGQNTAPLNFPGFTKSTDISTASWGSLKGLDILHIFNKAYDEIIKWRRNLFKVPSGKHGKEFVRCTSSLINHFNNDSSLQQAAMTALMVMPALLLQKPSRRSKTKDHNRHLENRLKMWQDGNITGLIKEGKAIQKRLYTSKPKPQHTHQVFTRLMLQGKVAAALRWVTNKSGTLLDPSPEVVSA